MTVPSDLNDVWSMVVPNWAICLTAGASLSQTITNIRNTTKNIVRYYKKRRLVVVIECSEKVSTFVLLEWHVDVVIPFLTKSVQY